MSIPATLLWMGLLLPTVSGQAPGGPLTPTLLQQALKLEKQGRWFEACGLYDELLSKDRNHPELRKAYRHCLRRFRQMRRLDDRPLQDRLGKLSPSEALDLYDQVIGVVIDNYVERERVDLTFLFRQGLQELRFALDEKAFIRRYLPRADASAVKAFTESVTRWQKQTITQRHRARLALSQVMQSAQYLRISPGVIALECACGACNSLDEYSLYLAPTRLSHAQTAHKSKYVGIGIDLTVVQKRFEVARVYRKSPAALAGLVKGDRITRIDGQAVNPSDPDLALERLRGEAGTLVELEFIPRGGTLAQSVKIERQEVLATSVDYEVRENSYIGYLHVHNFQESTLQEVKDVLMRWQNEPLRGIVLDLRGNPGGLFKPALGVAELFLGDTVIAFTHSPLPELNRIYRSHNPNPVKLPMIVLVDGETASAAEVLAGALKDNGRAIVVGHPTYGKGSIQGVFPLDRAPGGLRLTVARFTTPARMPYTGRGLLPDHTPLSETDGDAALKLAEALLLRMTTMPQ